MSVYANRTGQTHAGYGTHSYRWQDWVNLILGIWLFITPWIWGPGLSQSIAMRQSPAYTTSTTVHPPATTPGTTAAPNATTSARNAAMISGPAMSSEWNAWILGVIVFLVALWAMMTVTTVGMEWINVLAGIWLFFSPWILGFASGASTAAWNVWILGVIVFLVALSAVQQPGTLRSAMMPPSAPEG